MPDVRMPDGTIIRNVPEGTTKAQLEARWRQSRQGGGGGWSGPTDNSRIRGLALGALRPLDNLATWASHLPGMEAIDRFGQRIGLPSTKQAVRGNDRARQNNSRTGYQAIGNIAATLPTAYLPGGVVAQGAAAGALSAEKPNDLTNVATSAAVGGLAGKIGEKVAAPLLERAGRTNVARKAAQAVVNNLNSARKALPARVRPSPARMLPNPEITVADRAVRKTAPDVGKLRQNLQDAARLKLPYALADADPRLRMVAGSAVRKSPDARLLAEETLIPRANGQAERAVNAIDEHLAPITNIEQRGNEIRQAARTTAQPFYDEAYAQAAPVDEQIAAMLQTPAGKSALAEARTIAANQGRNPSAMGFDLNDQGEVILKSAPSMETLDLVKQGLDTVLNGRRNAFGKVDLEGDRVAQSVNDLLQRYKARLDQVSPAYQQARSVYAENIAPRTALNLGYETLPKASVPQRQIDEAITGLTDRTLPEAQRGYATAMADNVSNRQLSANPYDGIYGSPARQGKIDALFPEGSTDFGRIYQLEKDMAATARETLGGSPTASRLAADQNFDGNGFADMALDTVTNGGVSPGTAMKLGAKLLNRVRDAKMSQSRADSVAPTLLDTNPQNALRFVDEFAQKQAEMEARRRAYEQLFSPLGLAAVPLGNNLGTR